LQDKAILILSNEELTSECAGQVQKCSWNESNYKLIIQKSSNQHQLNTKIEMKQKYWVNH